MTTHKVLGFFPLNGSGYLRLDDGSTSMVIFKMVVSVDNLTGGGFIFGEEEFIHLAAKAGRARLEVSSDRCLGLALGIQDDSGVPVASPGLVSVAQHSRKKRG